ncbi:sensor histidine kinase [Rathayibacter sp. AY1D2]|uniref:sensor histidine kinase n=1 Tax=unclassified Rathayibacter TaxID=2609250 RepID=UPI000CE72634|nr:MULTISPECIES: histidine kinase [unclassified Rathayibacter]PPG60501.1 sensor histidine kinase [Rathayibacter sp. AY1C7]PPH49809.1 sensor histidine kinase [Rathayibacter sp. AY1E1]PPI18696.1 sensor histidine kinase [Rathayibacter sp. AY1D2]
MVNSTEADPPVRAGRGVAVTWWYTLASAASFVVIVLAVWSVAVLSAEAEEWRKGAYFLGAAAWVAVFSPTALAYRRADREGPVRLRAAPTLVFCLGVAAAALTGTAAGSLALGLSLAATLVAVLPWQSGVRLRVMVLCTIVLAVAAVLEQTRAAPDASAALSTLLLFATLLPLTVVSALWWWDIVRELDRARAAEGRLAAAQERLLLAGDVHDLQGHHLQVIALQLELAERLLGSDPEAALEQLRAAQRSVDGARTGTRELATRFRSVPLVDELANAADLLRSAGLRVELEVDPAASHAPAETLGPVVRETTTNILKHGGGSSARLRLAREQDEWRFEAVNDLAPDAEEADGTGSGVLGMAERVERAGGTLRAGAVRRSFELDARLPVGSDS